MTVHLGDTNDRTTSFTYQGLSNLVTEERQSTSNPNAKIKTYSYDNYGHRLTLTDANSNGTGTPQTFSYGHDVHNSVSQLITDTGSIKASYGYDAYGNQDQNLTSGDPDNQAPFNPFRYSDQRMDSATATKADGDAQYGIGARRWSPATTRFAQEDVFYGALANLGLSNDPLTQNRYPLAGGNPISYMEYDGHMPIANGGGGAINSGESFCFRCAEDQIDSSSPSSPERMGDLLLAPPPTKPGLPAAPRAPGTQPGARPTSGLVAILMVLSQILVSDSPQPEEADEPQPKRRPVDVKRQASRCFDAPGKFLAAIYYHNLDYQHGPGRATGAEGCLKRIVPEKDKRKRFTPPGFMGGDTMDRGHLIAAQFGGSNVKPENIVPLYIAANQEMNHGPEAGIRKMLNSGETVYLYSAPVYNDPSNPFVPTSIKMIISGSRSGLREPIFITNQP